MREAREPAMLDTAVTRSDGHLPITNPSGEDRGRDRIARHQTQPLVTARSMPRQEYLVIYTIEKRERPSRRTPYCAGLTYRAPEDTNGASLPSTVFAAFKSHNVCLCAHVTTVRIILRYRTKIQIYSPVQAKLSRNSVHNG